MDSSTHPKSRPEELQDVVMILTYQMLKNTSKPEEKRYTHLTEFKHGRGLIAPPESGQWVPVLQVVLSPDSMPLIQFSFMTILQIVLYIKLTPAISYDAFEINPTESVILKGYV